MRVFVFVVIVDVSRTNVILQCCKALGDPIHHVGMTAIEADSDVVEMHGLDKLNETIGCRQFIGNVFDQYSDAEWFGEGAQMLDGSHGSFEFLFVEGFVRSTDMLDEKAKRDLLGDL